MKLSQSVKILVGIGTFWILLYPVIIGGFILLMVLGVSTGFESVQYNLQYILVNVFGIIVVFSMPIQILLLLFYLIHVIKNKAGSEVVRVLLGIGLFLMPFMAMPIYYYTYIWRDPPPDWALADKEIDDFNKKKKTKPISSKNLLLLLVVVCVNLCICLLLASIFYATGNLE